MAPGAAIAALRCSAESSWALASRVGLAHLMWVSLELSVHGTRRRDGRALGCSAEQRRQHWLQC
eukprot:1758027-Prymnesium_polylepis.1